jgi:hypothetical protein
VLGDWDFNLRLMTLGDIDHIPRPLANYHHREASSGIYGNTVVDQTDVHNRHQIMIRNRLLRDTLQANPAMMGLLHVLASTGHASVNANEGSTPEIMRRLDSIERALGASAVDINVIRKRTAPWSRVIGTHFERTRAKISRWFSASNSNA